MDSDRQEAIYLNDHDRQDFLSVLRQVCGRVNLLVHTYCLMYNRYHLLFETQGAGLGQGCGNRMVSIPRPSTTTTQLGHVCQGRIKGMLVEQESYL